MENTIKIIFVDMQPDVVTAWKNSFQDYSQISIIQDSIFEVACDALVSPANSFGYMDGGLDMRISNFFGWHVQTRLQKIIAEKHHGELIVGTAEIVPTDHKNIPYVISAPTMRVPMILRDTVNVYLATRAVILLVLHGKQPDGTPIKEKVRSIAISGMGTGVGQVSPDICACQMKAAVDSVLLNKTSFPASWHEAQVRHQLLYGYNPRDLQY